MAFCAIFVVPQSYGTAPLPAGSPLAAYVTELQRLQREADWSGLERLSSQVFTAVRQQYGPNSPELIPAAEWLGIALEGQARHAEAEQLFRRVLTFYEKLPGGHDSLSTARTLVNIARCLKAENQYAEAELQYRRSISILEKAQAPENRDLAAALFDLAALYWVEGQYAKAEPLYQRADDIFERVLGPEHTDVATVSNDLAELYTAEGQYAKAERLYQRALAIREKALGPEHRDVAKTLNGLAELYRAQSQYAKAEPLYQRSLVIEEKISGAENNNVATLLNNLALLYVAWGDYAKAEPLYLRAIAIYEKVNPADNMYLARSLGNLAQLYHTQGKYAQAGPLAQRSLALKEQVFGPDSRDVAVSLNLLAGIDRDQGRYAQAQQRYQRSIDILQKQLGAEHPDVAKSLGNLGELYSVLGQYAQAETLQQRALAISEKALGPEHPDVAMALENLAHVYEAQGKPAKAETLLQRALAIREKMLGPDHIDVATTLSDLAQIYVAQGQYAQAESLYQRAIAVSKKALGLEHPYFGAATIDGLAALYMNEGAYAKAEPLYQLALEIRKKSLGTEHPEVARSLNNLAVLFLRQAQYGKAEPLFQRSIDIYEKALGAQHPSVATATESLAELYWSQGDFIEAEPLYRRALAILEQTLGSKHPDAAAMRAGLGIDLEFQGRFDLATANLRRACSDMNSTRGAGGARGDRVRVTFDMNECSFFQSLSMWGWATQGGAATPSDSPDALKLEAFVASQSAAQSAAGDAMARSAALTAANAFGVGPEARDYEAALLERDSLDAQFAKVASKPDQTQQANFAVLAKARNDVTSRLEHGQADLKSKAPLYWDYRSPEPVTVAALQATSGADAALLHENEALILFLATSPKYQGLVFAVTKERAAWARLSLSGSEIKARVTKLRGQIDPDGYGVPHAAQAGAAGYGTFDRQDCYELYQALLGDAAIQAVIQEKQVLLFVPSGPLTSLPPALLVTAPPAGGRRGDSDPGALRATAWLLRSKAVALLPAVSSLRTLRQILPSGPSPASDPLLAFADPDFDGQTRAPQKRSSSAAARGFASYYRDGVPLAEALDDLPRLPGTRIEAEALKRALHAGPESLLTGREASKAQLMARNQDGRLRRVRVLEFATHGLVAGDASDLAEPALALAAGATPADELLLASEASTLKLNADWVLLSACNTASPDAPEAQGLSGLSRAFFYAGARSLLVSHWRVRDDVAPRLIPAMLLAERDNPSLSRAEALRQASLAILDDTSIDGAAPSAWAAFTLIGEAAR